MVMAIRRLCLSHSAVFPCTSTNHAFEGEESIEPAAIGYRVGPSNLEADCNPNKLTNIREFFVILGFPLTEFANF